MASRWFRPFSPSGYRRASLTSPRTLIAGYRTRMGSGRVCSVRSPTGHSTHFDTCHQSSVAHERNGKDKGSKLSRSGSLCRPISVEVCAVVRVSPEPVKRQRVGTVPAERRHDPCLPAHPAHTRSKGIGDAATCHCVSCSENVVRRTQ